MPAGTPASSHPASCLTHLAAPRATFRSLHFAARPPHAHPVSAARLQCHLSGCMMDLFMQMAIIMILKQTLSNCVEYLSP